AASNPRWQYPSEQPQPDHEGEHHGRAEVLPKHRLDALEASHGRAVEERNAAGHFASSVVRCFRTALFCQQKTNAENATETLGNLTAAARRARNTRLVPRSVQSAALGVIQRPAARR